MAERKPQWLGAGDLVIAANENATAKIGHGTFRREK